VTKTGPAVHPAKDEIFLGYTGNHYMLVSKYQLSTNPETETLPDVSSLNCTIYLLLGGVPS
jgi:hypothetical protein